jgi:hypothetical protein
MYKLQKSFTANEINAVQNLSSGWFIPFAPDNMDYQQFKRDIQNGVVLNDADGNPVTGDALTTFIGTLP